MDFGPLLFIRFLFYARVLLDDSSWANLDCLHLARVRALVCGISDEVAPWVPCEKDCYDHGRCEDGLCNCDEGWQGRFCNEKKVGPNGRGVGACATHKCAFVPLGV